MHAKRQQRYRQRQQIVTHQGFLDVLEHDLLSGKANKPRLSKLQSIGDQNHCHFCNNQCSQYLRLGFLRRYSYDEKLFSSWPTGP